MIVWMIYEAQGTLCQHRERLMAACEIYELRIQSARSGIEMEEQVRERYVQLNSVLKSTDSVPQKHLK
jgi:hypothetical protein